MKNSEQVWSRSRGFLTSPSRQTWIISIVYVRRILKQKITQIQPSQNGGLASHSQLVLFLGIPK